MKNSLDVAGFMVKVDNGLGGILIYHEYSICTWSYKGRVYGRREGARICVCAWFQCLFDFLGGNDVDFADPDENSCKGYVVRDVLVFVPRNNGGCSKVTVDKLVNSPDCVMVTEIPYVIIIPMREDFYADHGINGLVGTFHFTAD